MKLILIFLNQALNGKINQVLDSNYLTGYLADMKTKLL
jgi:hypothetical protein